MENRVRMFCVFILIIFLVHLSALKVYSWFRHHGGTDYDDGRSIQQTSDGGYIVAGQINSFTHGFYDFAIYKLDSDGNK